jgi:drug/metabolite transporter (DMT)-like permease
MPVVTVLVGMQPAGAIVLGAVVAARAIEPSGREFLWGTAAGIGLVIGLLTFYRGLALGMMAVVAPITAAAPVIPVVVGVVRGERPSSLQVAGMAVALVGVVLASLEPESAVTGRRLAVGAGYGIVAAAAFGSTLVTLDSASNDDPYWGTFAMRVAATLLVVLVAAVRVPRLPERDQVLPLAAIGVTDAAATCLFAVATTKGLVSVVSVLASLFPIVVVLWALAYLRERVAASQLTGGALALAGTALIAAG